MAAQRIWSQLSCLFGPEAKHNPAGFQEYDSGSPCSASMNFLIKLSTVFSQNKGSFESKAL